MIQFLSWYIVISLLGLLTFPLTYRLFPALADRGYTLARAVGLLVWGYVFWMLASLGMAQNDIGGLLLAVCILAGLSGWAFRQSLVNRKSSITAWLKANARLIVTTEILFFLAFSFLAFVRASNPEATGTEKPMELAFITAIIRSPTFPPRDPWLSGYAISYYYFGYVMTAMLAKATGALGSVAHNLMSALVFALSALGAYGVVYNLLSAYRNHQSSTVIGKTSIFNLPLLGPLFLLIVSNLEGFLAVLHRRGLFWKFAPDGTATSSFWTWLEIKDLQNPPNLPLSWDPRGFWWWWRASRVIMDYDLAGKSYEIIDEFPAFSYVLGDLHPHVLAMPFGLLAIAVALNLFLGGWKGETNLFGLRLPLHPLGLVFSALTLGGLAFLNTWDILPYTALVLGAFVLARVRELGWSWKRLEDFFALAIPMGLLSLLLYLPFYIGFSSQAGGIIPNLMFVTRGAQLWVMFASLFLPIFAYLIYLWRGEKQKANWLVGLGLSAGLSVLLWGFSWLLGLAATKVQGASFVADFLASQDSVSIRDFFVKATVERLMNTGGWLTLAALLAVVVAMLAKATKNHRLEVESPPSDGGESQSTTLDQQSSPVNMFVLLLILLGGLLVLAPEYVYLRDYFGWRMNTIFKFYYQVWMLWSMAAAFGAAVMLGNLRRAWGWIYRIGLSILLIMALVYPILGFSSKTDNFQWDRFTSAFRVARLSGDWEQVFSAFSVWTLDGGAYLDQSYPDDAEAIRWLRTAPDGILVEAVGNSYNQGRAGGTLSTFTGLPTVLNWPGHESQWRGSGFAEQAGRDGEIRRLYETSSWEEARGILAKYDIRYVYIGTLERMNYRVDEEKFQHFLTPVFQSGNVIIYEVP